MRLNHYIEDFESTLEEIPHVAREWPNLSAEVKEHLRGELHLLLLRRQEAFEYALQLGSLPDVLPRITELTVRLSAALRKAPVLGVQVEPDAPSGVSVNARAIRSGNSNARAMGY